LKTPQIWISLKRQKMVCATVTVLL